MQAGDTLSRIADRYGTTWDSLVYWNRDRYAALNPDSSSYNPDQIDVGWQLRLKPGVVLDYDAPPPPTPQPTPPPVEGRAIGHGSRSTNDVALTFDMGGRSGDAVAIVSWLRDHGVHATVFMTGAVAETSPGRQVLSIIDSSPSTFDLGNHSFSHPQMPELTADAMADQIGRADAALRAAAAAEPRPLFRPPFGAWNQTLVEVAASEGYPYTILWDVDPRDWNPESEGGPTTAELVDRVVSNTQNGSIVLMHLGGYHTYEALPTIVSRLRDRGVDLVTLDELLGTG